MAVFGQDKKDKAAAGKATKKSAAGKGKTAAATAAKG